ncbi:filamentous hemagglutinin N-terminal domain-containing protein [Pseudomonas sp. FP1742]|uniref:two-partner secretion domain-containing protein n=1 Tax=Pseudomonas sp. FP1742 TaxID=2954079 RepID=UPI002735BCA4|nr:filamentous hemagglutinin N-terminal domain-containing protein [Pseudomonas sp. FP1742]WLG52999.1 filamentous hemagglutinin N-terminal domain-containing protein [Pseudomonas sp. FP1742]
MDVRQLAFLAGQPSAAVKNREHFWGMPKRGLAFLLANVMFWQPMWAQADGIVVATPGTSLGQAGNGVPIVQIATPNGTGLSHNQFHDYNVGTQGVILNNVANQTGATQLGGIIVGNPNLTSGVAAQTILNEVVGGSPSQLRGYTEVAGQSARVIVANPYGISCNGCGFINTPRVTLTTGKPVLDNGRLDRFQVDQGSVTIDGAGLNANNVDRFEIITRSAKINAEIQAKNLTIVAGRNDVNADSLNATARADDGSAKPQLAIDSSALGGMYAGAIKLVGTEAGVGVKLDGNLAASGGDIQLDANGHLSLAQTSAAGAVNVKAASLDARGPVYAGTAVNVQTQGNLTNQQTLAARDSIALTAGGVLTNNGIIEAGVNADTSRNASGDVNLNAQNFTNTGKSVVASRNLTVNTSQTLNNQGGTLSAGQIANITVGTLDNQNSGRVLSSGNLNLTANQVLNSNGLITSTGHLDATLGHLNNRTGELSSLATATLRMATLDNVAGLVNAGQALSITTTGAVNNQGGKLTSLDSLSLNAGQVDNSSKGRIASNKALTVSVSSLDQHDGGQLTSNTSLTLDLNHGELNNQNGLINAPALVLKNLAQVNNRNGEISSAQAFTLAADSLDNSDGKLLGNQAVTLRVQQALTNIKGLIAAASVDVQAGSLNNNGGTLTSRTGLELRVTGQLDNQDQGLINASQNLNINAASLNNQNGGSLLGSAIAIDFSGAMGDLNNANGLITTTGQLSIRNLRDLNNRGGELSSSQSYTLTGRNLDNSDGKLISRQQLDLTADATTNLNGLISGWQSLSLLGGSLDNRNQGTLSSRDGDVLVDLTGAVRNSNAGALVSHGTLKVTAASLDNSDNGILSSAGAQTLVIAGTLNNAQGGLIDSGAALDIQAQTLSNANATINAQQDIRFTGTDLNNSAGTFAGKGAITLDLLGTLTNTSGKLASNGPLVIQRARQIDNQGGQLASQGLLNLLTGGLDNRNGGTVAANDWLTLTANGVVQNSANGQIFSSNAGLTLNAASLDNAKGTLQSQGDLTVKTSGAIDNQSGRIVAKDGNLDITAASLDSRGGVLSSLKGAFSSHITGVLRNGYDLNNNRQGGIIQAQSLNLKALAGLDNYGGRITAQTGDAIVDTGTNGNFDNRNGGLYAKGRVSVTGNNFDNSGDNDGQIGGQQIDLSLRGALNNRLGIIESESTLSITAASLDNQTGQLRALGNTGKTAFAISGVFDNRNGTVESANSDLSLGAGGLLNVGGNVLHVGTGIFDIATGQLGSAGGNFVTRGGLTLTADSWTNSSVIQAGQLSVNVGSFTQTASGQLLASTAFSGTGGTWQNDGLIASDGTFNLNLSGAYNGTGRTTSLGALKLAANQLNLGAAGSIAGGAHTEFAISGALSSAGRITSAADLLINANSIVNQGTLGAAQKVELNTPSLMNNGGLLFSGADMSLAVTRFTNQAGDLYGLGDVLIKGLNGAAQASQVANLSGSMESGGTFTLNAGDFQNRTLGDDGTQNFAVGRKLVSGYIAVHCLDCDGPHFQVDYVAREFFDAGQDTDTTPSALLSAGRDLTFNGGTFLNSKSTVTAAGNIAIHADTLKNVGAVGGAVERTRIYETPWRDNHYIYDYLPQVVAYNQRNNPIFPNVMYVDSNGEFRVGIPVVARAWDGDGNATGVVNVKDALTDALVSYGRWPITQTGYDPDNIPNSQYDPNNLVQVPTSLEQYTLISDTEVAIDGTSAAAGRNAVIQAGGKVTITATQDLQNSVIHEDYATNGGANKVANTQASGTGNTVALHLNAQLAPDLAQQQVNPLTLPGFSLPVGQNGLFRLSQEGSTNPTGTGPQSWSLTGATVTASTSAPVTLNRVQGLPNSAGKSQPHKYLIETNPVLTDLKQFMSSDYLLSNLGYNPDTSAKRLGDGLYEQRLIQQAVVARTGQRYIDGQTSDEGLFKYLMNNAIASKDALNLSVGVSLTSQQVAALTHDIVWLEEHEVNGEKVLVPVLYLAQAEGRLGPTGALIAGNDVTLIAGQNLDNVGTLRATHNLSATAGKDLVSSGLIQAGNRLDVLAGNDVVNKSGGILAGRDVSVTATRGDVLNERTVTAMDSNTRFGNKHIDYADSAARIEAANDLSVSAGRDIANAGGVLSSGRDMALSAGRDVAVTSAVVATNDTTNSRISTSSTKQLGASVSAGRDLAVEAGRDIAAVASQIDAKRDISMTATDNLTISSAADEEHSLSKSKKLTRQEDHVSQVMSGVTAGGNLKLDAGKDLAVISSRISAGDEAYLVAGDNLDILAAKDSDYSLYDMKKKGSFGAKKTKRDEVTDVKYIGSEITTGGNLTLVSGGDQRYQVAKLESGKDITLDSGGAIVFEGVKDLHDESHTKSDGDAFWTSSKGKGNTDETLRQTQMIAKGNITIKAVEGLRIDLKEVNQQSVSQTIDAMVKADPQLAWLKQAEARGDVDWRQVKEIHESFKYSNSGLGPASQLIIAIALAAVMGPMMAGMNTMMQAVAVSAATKATVSTIDNRGNLGKVIKDVTSKDSIKGYVVAAATAGVMDGLNYNPGKIGFDANSLKIVAIKVTADAVIKTAVYGGSFKDNLASSAVGVAASIGGAIGAGKIGDLSLPEGGLAKILLHAGLGGLLAEAMGGDFRTGALAGGANEVLVGLLGDKLLPSNLVPGSAEYNQAQANILALSQIVGVLGAAASGGDVGVGAAVAANATQYNFLGDHAEAKRDRAREEFKETNRIGAARQLVELEGADQRSDNLLAKYRLDKSSLSAAELAELNAYVQVYTYDMALKYGEDVARTLANALIQNGPDSVGIYPYAGTTEAKNAYADALRAQLGGWGEQLAWTRPKSENELVYKDAQGYLQINNEQQGLSNLGSPALYGLTGPLGAGIRIAAAANGALQAAYGANQAFNGDLWNAAGNIVVGALGVASVKVPSTRLPNASGIGELPVVNSNTGNTLVKEVGEVFDWTAIGAKGIQKVPGFGEVDDFFASQSANLNKKLGTKIGEGRLPYETSRAGVEQAKATVKETLENVTSVSPLIPSSTVRGNYDLIHVYSSKTNSTVSLRVLPDGRYEFDTLIPEKSSKF